MYYERTIGYIACSIQPNYNINGKLYHESTRVEKKASQKWVINPKSIH